MRYLEQRILADGVFRGEVVCRGGHGKRDGCQHEQGTHGLVCLRIEVLIVVLCSTHQKAAA